jgi:2-polyprenyl-3-methyl-5-hydroxy-6-metoxy-1,4-benzoquinol methylase
MSHPDADPATLARLAAELADQSRQESGHTLHPVPVPPEAPVLPARARWKQAVKRATKPVADPALDRLANRVADLLKHRLDRQYSDLLVRDSVMQAEVAALRDQREPELGRLTRDALARVAGLEINLELMKGELQAFDDALEQLGMAIAPGAGFVGVPERFAELRERVNALDRRLRATTTNAARTPVAPSSGTAAPATTSPDPASSGSSTGFDYVGFEGRFRGDSATVLATLEERYLRLLEEHQPVLDFGCGRGELVATLRAHGIEAEGVDPDAGMVEEAQSRDLPVHLADGIAWLRAAPEHSLGSIISVHVVEHLPLATLVELLELAATRLEPGGIFVAETPNPASLIVLGNSYILDPTHVWPLHPSLLTFLCERAGFRDVRLEFHAPAEDYQLPPIDAGPDGPAWVNDLNARLEQLNEVLFGPQEYAAIARTPS